MYSNSRARSTNSRNGHCERPLGSALQLSATSRASRSPSETDAGSAPDVPSGPPERIPARPRRTAAARDRCCAD